MAGNGQPTEGGFCRNARDECLDIAAPEDGRAPALLFGALVNPGANQADLFRSQWFRRRAAPALSARSSARRRAAGSASIAARTTGATARRRAAAGSAAAAALGRHRGLGINLRGRHDQQACLAVTGNDHFSLVPSLQDSVQTVQAQILFGLFLAVATHAGSLEEGKNILVKGDVFLIGNGRQFADIHFGDVPFVGRRSLGSGRKSGQQQSASG